MEINKEAVLSALRTLEQLSREYTPGSPSYPNVEAMEKATKALRIIDSETTLFADDGYMREKVGSLRTNVEMLFKGKGLTKRGGPAVVRQQVVNDCSRIESWLNRA